MTIKSFLKLFILVDIVIVIICLIFYDNNWLINSQISFVTSLIITLGTYLSYKNNVQKNIQNEMIPSDADMIDKMDDPYDLYSSDVNEEVIEHPTKEQILEANKPIKQKHFTNLKKSILSYASFYRIGGYVTLIIGFFYLVNNHLFDVWAYLFGFIVVEILIKRFRDSKKDILHKIERFEKEKLEYKTTKHYSQHDIKTNSQIILDKLFAIYLKIKDNKEAVKILAELNLLEYTILQANSYSKNDYATTNQYRFHKDIYDENFVKFFQKKPFEKELLQIAKNNIFKIKIDIEDIEEYTVNLRDKKFNQNELSLVFFKLLNNAIKHRKKDSIIDVYIGKDKQNRFMVKMVNEIIDDEECKEVKTKIENSLKFNNSHNMSIIQQILNKYELEIKFECKDKMLEVAIQTRSKE